MARVIVHPEVEDALRRGRPVVALETAVLTHGLPRKPIDLPREIPGWSGNGAGPLNLEVALAMASQVRDGGATPATIAVVSGTLHIGVEKATLAELAEDHTAEKASTTTLAARLASGQSAGTTVSASLAACGLCPAGSIRVLSTGGIGGAHPRWEERLDVSADLRQIGTTPCCVVCAGVKSILDIAATAEILDTLGVPTVGYRTDDLPRFYLPGTSAVKTSARVEDATEAARMCLTRWHDLDQRAGLVLVNPIAPEFALEEAGFQRALDEAGAAARAQEVTGANVTPFLLDALTRLTDGRSVTANVALLLGNARLATEVAIAIASGGTAGIS